MTFFQDFPVPKPPSRGRAVRYVPPVWAGKPQHEIPATVSLGKFLHHPIRQFSTSTTTAALAATTNWPEKAGEK